MPARTIQPVWALHAAITATYPGARWILTACAVAVNGRKFLATDPGRASRLNTLASARQPSGGDTSRAGPYHGRLDNWFDS